MYITIDGDDVGRNITASYIANDEIKLIQISNNINDATKKISSLLFKSGFEIVFQAADGVTAKIDMEIDLYAIFNEIQLLAFDGITFSAGVGMNLREAYIALLNSKSNGKNMLSIYNNI